MTDKELLELAAKAAEMNVIWDEERLSMVYFAGSNSRNPNIWNPLTDDGDALRLAMKLKLVVAFYDDACEVENLNGDLLTYEVAAHKDEINAATRRAIVRAAAEIGKGMK